MTYLIFLLTSCFILGIIGVVSGPSPLFGVSALVGGAMGGCGVLIGLGGSFIGLVLLLIYLGGMLVVFAYSVALAAEPYPLGWNLGSVFSAGLGYVMFVLFLGLWVMEAFVESGVDGSGLFYLRNDFNGVMLLFSMGGWFLFLAGVGLLITLFVVMELVRGRGAGSLRVP